MIKNIRKNYLVDLQKILNSKEFEKVNFLAESLYQGWKKNKNLFLCGNGGSGANAIHLANDYLFGAGRRNRKGLRVEALTANSAVITCLANDTGYENIFSEQLKVKGQKGDILIVLSGSGNSKNILNVLRAANKMKIKTFAILGYDGGKAKKLTKHPIHFEINDMQISEDLQLIVGHICMKYLCTKKF
jgi:D-sedoheptulose 7-phosphate isomerase